MSKVTTKSFSLRRFLGERDGHVAVIFGAALVPVVFFVGATTDYARAVRARTQLQAAVDAAALAGVNAKDATPAQREVIAVDVFNANRGNNPTTSGATGTAVASGSTVTVTANHTVPTTFMKIAQINSLPVNVTGAASSNGKTLELAMMIDLTGSMGGSINGQTKIAGLKEAGADLLNILFPGGASTSSSVRVAVAPFADYVNAGAWADEATGLPATGGSYTNLTNLASTKQGTFNGSYTGLTGNTAGSQAGATSPSSAQAGATFSNGHCANPTTTTTITQMSYNGYYGSKPLGVRVSGSGSAPAQVIYTSTGFYKTNYRDNDGSSQGWRWYSYGDEENPNHDSSGHYIPLPASTDGVTYLKEGSVYYGVRITLEDSNDPVPSQLKKVGQGDVGSGFRKITGYSNGNFTWEWSSSGAFAPVPTNMSSTVTSSECTTTAQPSGKLITCVTERVPTASRYTDAAPSGSDVVGPYNHGVTTKSNYSSDGKCYVAGRELPSIIPLTNEKAPLSSFFTNATIGGATPGHLGTAWAWYMLSPNWASVFTGSSAPVAYDLATNKKAAILMTDGEYNIHYTSPLARDQALALCANMKAAGIQVFTVGFGFPASTLPTDNTAAGKAKDLLMQCASDSASYFFPYDGPALKSAFSNIGQALMAGQDKVRITN
jgi:Flp pilus assembly protein TadG